MTRWIGAALAGGTLVCIGLAATVSATPPDGEGIREIEEAPSCTKYLIENARDTIAGDERYAIMAGRDRPKNDFVAAMHWIETHDEDSDTTLSARSTLARCGESTTVDRCFGYIPETAEQLQRDDFEDGDEWIDRVARAHAEAKVCGATLPEAVDPGPDCSVENLHALRLTLARAHRDSLLGVSNEYTRSRVQYRLSRCGVSDAVDPCYGDARGELLRGAMFYREQERISTERERHYWRRIAEKSEREAALCP